MRTEERIVNEVAAALERETSVNLHRFPLQLGFSDGILTMEGEVDQIMAKKRALEVAAAVPGVAWIVDRVRLAPASAMEDGEIREHVCTALLADNQLASCAIWAMVKGKPEVIRETDQAIGSIDVEVRDGVVVLNGAVTSLSAKRLAGVLAWWVPGSRDVINGLDVSPSQEDNDDEVVDAVRLALEKDPFVNASQIRVSCAHYTVTLEGLVRNETERRMAEADAWYVFRVDRVTNLLRVET
ncbi:BON domain-containing protein [Pelobacter propionicus]|uniref:Transport-associated protein n=1 Tax=Pelobacter propionicus (strain DSM 2379 / NBRC 103807 / OttBd1) TaxID=338966 RepID=A1ASW4_PELPD|nr:BON domain-containing protein [Pelobacter propionicus]ABL00435.1 transport-associated protein [Pelobacter propionicus DSM 2379]